MDWDLFGLQDLARGKSVAESREWHFVGQYMVTPRFENPIRRGKNSGVGREEIGHSIFL